ncbi:MAG TPA: hypothetical protein VF487_19620 [Chitinophagaceae bacterium]
MPDIFYLLSKWWKHITGLVLLSLLTAWIITSLLPKEYVAATTALPANSYLSDKSKIFNENIEALYSAMGTADELDMIIGTGQLDTIYLSVVDRFNLTTHYGISEKGEAARSKASLLLKKHTRVMKTEYGELKVRVWDTDKLLSAQFANAIMDKIQQMHSDLQNSINYSTLNSLLAARGKIKSQPDSVHSSQMVTAQLQQYEKLIGEYQLMVDTKPPALLIVERARPASFADRPQLLQAFLITGFFSLLFAFLLVMVLEKKKSNRR